MGEDDEQEEPRSLADNLAFIRRPRMRGETDEAHHSRLQIATMADQLWAQLAEYSRTITWAPRRRDQ